MSVTQLTVTVEGGVASQPVNRHMKAVVGQVRQVNCLCQCVVSTWRRGFLLDTLCCLWDSWRVTGKNLEFICSALYASYQCYSLPGCWI